MNLPDSCRPSRSAGAWPSLRLKAIGTALAGLGGLLSDIDEPQSIIGNSPRIIARGATSKSRRGSLPRLAFLVIGELLTGFVQALATVIRELTGHLGATHWLLAALVIALPAFTFLGLHAGLYLAVSYLSHLALDMLTRNGVPLLGPFSKRRLHLLPTPLRVRTGGSLDHFIQFAAGLAYGALMSDPDASDLHQAVVVEGQPLSLRPVYQESLVFSSFAPVLQRVGEDRWRLVAGQKGWLLASAGDWQR